MGRWKGFDKESLFLFEGCLGRAVRAKWMFELDAKVAKVKPIQMKRKNVRDV